MGLRWTSSARKHGVTREDAVYAIMNAVRAESEFNEPPMPGLRRPMLFIGPPRQRDGPLLEVMVETLPSDDVVVFHVMVARARHLRRMVGKDDIHEQ